MRSKSENAAPAKGGEFGIREKAWQPFEYQTQRTTATIVDGSRWQYIGDPSLDVLVNCFIKSRDLKPALGRAVFELARLGSRAA